MTDDLISKSATDLCRLLAAGAISSAEIVAACLRRIDEMNPSLNAVVTVAPEVMDRARQLDSDRAQGKIAGPLHGLPITIKDTIDTANIRTTRGSRLFADHVPASDAVVVAKLKAAGAIVLGKTNVPEMAVPYETNNLVFGRTNNPRDLSRTPGGSSGGEAAAIAAGLSPAGIGSDLSGSIRIPAHFCGIAGLKPTTGAVSMAGHLPQATGTLSLGAAIGPMATRVADLALLFNVISDQSTAELRYQDQELSGVGVACCFDQEASPVQDEIAGAVRQAASILSEAGLTVVEECPSAMSHAARLWIELFSRPANQQIRDLYRGREDQSGLAVSRLLPTDHGTTFEERIEIAEALAAAVVERERRREQLLRWMRHTPLILAPVSATPAFEHGATRVTVHGRSISVFRSCSYAHMANAFGLPAVVVPVARTAAGLPIGVQLIGRPWAEAQVLAVAAIIERETGCK
ncbi:MAG TPA: amidase [Pyrinomonadaceae bacterium]|nr:amidase [Pyrinomonadaceae bacterium]